ncbi:MAG: acyl-CoA dehydrogenase [Dehalococcoidia bacterium]|nr:acyl-CoA dehydrogenase [Dehalococcoidia bacterium]
MDFELTEEQKMFQSMVRDFALKEVAPGAAQRDEDSTFPAEIVKKLGELGIMGVSYPEKYGGSGGDSVQQMILLEELSRVEAGLGTVYIGTMSLCCYPIYKFASEELRHKYVTPLAQGKKTGCFALTEPSAGSDATAIQTTAVKEGKDYVLNGSKIFITNGNEADTIVVFVTLDRSLRHRGVIALVLDKKTPGFSVGKKEHKMGIRCSSTTELIFENCRVPASNLLSGEGKGFNVAIETIDSSRAGVAAQAVGIAQGAFDAALQFSKDRQQFGQAISGFQAIQWMLADMATRIEASRLLTYQAAQLKDAGKSFVKQAAMAKLFASEAAMWVTTKAVQVHGGYGYVKDYPVERFFRDAKITEIYEGTSEMQRMTIARHLIKG